MGDTRETYVLDLDVSSFVNKYKSAIDQMKAAGLSGDVTKGLKKELDTLTESLNYLQEEGKEGFLDGKQVEDFRRRVTKVLKEFTSFENRIDNIGTKLGQWGRKSAQATAKIKEALNALQLTDVENGLDRIVKAENRQKETEKVLNEELEKRVKLYDQLAAKSKEGRDISRVFNDKNESILTDISSGTATYMDRGKEKNIYKSGSIGPTSDERSALYQTIRDAVGYANTLEEALQRVDSFLNKDNFKSKLTNQGQGVRAFTRELWQNWQQSQAAMQGAEQADQQLISAEQRLLAMGEKVDGEWRLRSDVMKNASSSTKDLDKVERKLDETLDASARSAEGLANAERDVNEASNGLKGSAAKMGQVLNQNVDVINQSIDSAKEASSTFDQLKSRLLMFFSVTSVINTLKKQIRDTYNDVKKLDKAFASIAMVTSNSVQGMWSSYGRYASMAAELGQKTEDVVKASALFYQQGLDTNEAFELTTDTMKLATLAGNDFSTATEEMTSAIRGFRMEMDNGAHVTDVYSELAAHAAANVDGIAQAMARTASIANSAGMSFENTAAFLTQVIETTQESAENIGTSLKTIIARFTELKTNVAGTADSEFDDLDFNKVDTALKSVGVSLKDTNGQFRDLDQVFLELSKKWSTLDRNTQRYVATIAAGSRQQSRFIAMMDNYDRTVELIEMAANAEGKADEQFNKYADTMEYKLNQLGTTWEQFRVRLMDADMFKDIVDGVNELVKRINAINFSNAFDFSKFAIGIPVIVSKVKSMSVTFIRSFQETTKQIKILGTSLRTNIGNIRPFNTAKKDLIKYEQELVTAINKTENLKNVSAKPQMVKIIYDAYTNSGDKVSTFLNNLKEPIQTQFKLSDEETKEKINQIREALRLLGQEGAADGPEAIANGFRSLKGEIQGVGAALDNVAKQKAKITQTQKIVASFGQIGAQVFNALTTSLMGWINGLTTFEQAAKSFVGMSVVMVAQLGMQKAVTIASTVANQLAKVSEDELTAAKARDATATKLKIAAQKAEVSSTLAVAAATTIAIAAVAALVAIFYTIGSAAKRSREAKQAEAASTSKLATENERLSDSYAKTKEKAEKARSVMEDSKEVIDRLTEADEKYLKQRYLTDEELEEWKNEQQEIAKLVPELVERYDIEGNAILKMGQSWDKALESKRAYYEESNAEYNKLNLEASVLKIQESQGNLTLDELYKTYSEDKYIDRLMKATSANKSGYDRYGIWDEEGNFQELENLTGVGAIKAMRDSDQAEDYGKYLREAIISGGLGNKFSVNEDSSGLDTLEKIDEALHKGGTDIEDATLEQLITALENYPRELEKNINENKQLIQEQKAVFDKGITSSVTGTLEMTDVYNDAEDPNVKKIMAQYVASINNLSYEELEKSFKELDGTKQWLDENGEVIPEYITDYNNALNKYIEEQTDKEAIIPDNLEEIFTKTAQAAIEQFYYELESKGLSTEDAYNLLVDTYKNILPEEVFNVIKSNYEDLEKLREQRKKGFTSATGWNPDIGGTETKKQVVDYYDSLGDDAQQAFVDALGKVDNTKTAQQLAQRLTSAMSDASEDVRNYLSTLNWEEDYSLLTEDSFKQGTLTTLAEEYHIYGEEALKYYEAMKQFMSDSGVINLEYVNTAQLASWQEKIEAITDVIQKNDDIIKKYAQDNREYIRLSQEDYDKLNDAKKALEDAGVSAEQLDAALDFKGNEWVLNGKLWNDTIKKASIETSALAQQQLKVNEEKLKDVNLTTEERRSIEVANEQLSKMIVSQQELNKHTAATAGYWVSITDLIENYSNLSSAFGTAGKAQKTNGYLGTKEIQGLVDAFHNIGDTSFDVSKFVNNQLQLNIDALYDYVNAQISALEASGKFAEANGEQIMIWQAMRKELIATKNEVNATANALQDNLTEATDNYNKQLEAINDKQEALNDRLKEYQDLLYGSDYRKSGLDLLYNYEQAISSLNEEMERTKDLLGDSKTIDEAYTNLKKYTSATHDYLVEERARQEVIKQGLANYANMIENGSASYTDQESGRRININFGDYARLDSRTGKYMLDQRLLEESKFADKYKDLIEQQISEHNSYVDKLKQSEDGLLKIEKEFQKQREEAVKNYASMEKTLADALKAQYEEEVNNLKDKYDAMKDADDDYLDALKDAIDRQRKLREQENSFEELAKKEKKLSLMRRDTSGANGVEVRNLEDEVQKDREQLLDSAIDNVIDGLSELYESQQELRETEMELKDALLENTLYWNMQAQDLAASFTNADEYAQYLSSISKEYAESTLAMQQEKLNEYGNEFSQASQYLAMTAMDAASETGDFVVDVMTVSGEEISNVVANTSETFTTEVTRAYNETTDAFIEDLEKAQDAIKKARDDLQEAINKLSELATKANEAAAALNNANETIVMESPNPNAAAIDRVKKEEDVKAEYVETAARAGAPAAAVEGISANFDGDAASEKLIKMIATKGSRVYLTPEQIEAAKRLGFLVGRVGPEDGNNYRIFTPDKERELENWLNANAVSYQGNVKRYLEGGLVNQTGLAYVDGTPERPEAFLNAEDTKNIGEAAKILSDIPYFNGGRDESTTITNNNGGDISVEINLNIDHISSDVDIDEMIERVKEEVVEVARPTGTNVILNQQLG